MAQPAALLLFVLASSRKGLDYTKKPPFCGWGPRHVESAVGCRGVRITPLALCYSDWARSWPILLDILRTCCFLTDGSCLSSCYGL